MPLGLPVCPTANVSCYLNFKGFFSVLCKFLAIFVLSMLVQLISSNCSRCTHWPQGVGILWIILAQICATGFLAPLLYFRLFFGQLQTLVLVTFAQIWFYDQSLSVTFLTTNLPIFKSLLAKNFLILYAKKCVKWSYYSLDWPTFLKQIFLFEVIIIILLFSFSFTSFINLLDFIWFYYKK